VKRALLGFALVIFAALALLRPPQFAVPPTGTILTGVQLVNPGLERLPGRTIHVQGDRIDRIDATPGEAPPGPWAGRTVLPGLIDLHVHHPPALAWGEPQLFSLLFLAYGVTTVRDVGSVMPRALDRHARAIAEGRRPGPRTLRCGPFVDGAPPDWPGARVVHDPAEAERAVREVAEAGYDCVKLYNKLDRESLAAALGTAAELGLPVVAHVPHSVPGIDSMQGAEIQHLMGLVERFSRPPEERIDAYVGTSVRLGLTHVPTIVAFARAAEIPGARPDETDPVLLRMPSYQRDILWRRDGNPLARHLGEAALGRPALMKQVVRRLHAAGVPVLAGTDTLNPRVVPGASLHEELAHLVDAGLSPEEAWVAASRGAGAALGVPNLGHITPGAPADLLIFRDDPTRDLAALDSLEAVVAAGRLYPRAALDAEAERALAHHDGFPYGPLSRGLARLSRFWLPED